MQTKAVKTTADDRLAPRPILTMRSYAEDRERWHRMAQSSAAATLYHDPKWIELLQESYRLPMSVARAILPDGEEAACVLAHPRVALKRRTVGLPFSDLCPPLAREPRACQALLRGLLAAAEPGTLELRGVAAPPPWRVVSTYALWTLDLNRPLARLQQDWTDNFRRNLKKAARSRVELEVGHGPELLTRFHALHFQSRYRQGLPAQPRQFFLALGERFRPANAIEVWLASRERRDLASVLLLHAGSRLYYKWSARRAGEIFGAGQLLLGRIIECAEGNFAALDLGRADVRNAGLSRFKAEAGAVATGLPYSFAPSAPSNISAEKLSGANLLLSRVWKRLPAPLARVLGGAIYGMLS